MPSAFQVHASDNVATLLGEADAGSALAVTGPGGMQSVSAREKIALGHKVALAAIAAGETVTKFGVPIGVAARPIAQGEWVHLHNCRSRLDARSGGFDLHTGAPGDNAHG